MTAVDALKINCWRLEWLVTAEPTHAPFAARSMTDDVAKLLTERLGGITFHADATPESILFIDQLMLDGDVGAAWSRNGIPDRVASKLAHQLSRALASGGHSGVMFRDRAEFLASFIIDAHAGRAGDNWRYAEFRGIGPLPFSNAVRTLAEGEPMTFYEALKRLDPSALDRVLAGVNPVDARRILAVYRPGTVASDDLDVLEAVLRELESSPGAAPLTPGRDVPIVLFARLARAVRSASPEKIASALETLAALLSVLDREAARTGLDTDRCLAALSRAAPAVAARLAAPFTRERERSLALLRGVESHRKEGSKHGAPAVGLTPFGGALMLLGLLADLGVCLDTLPECSDTPGEALGRLLLTAHAFGHDARNVVADPVLRNLLGIAPSLTGEQAATWFRKLGEREQQSLALEGVTSDLSLRGAPAAHETHATYFTTSCPQAIREGATALLRAFAFRLRGFAGSSPAFLKRNFLASFAQLIPRDDGWLAYLSPPPLDLVLRMIPLKTLSFQTRAGGPRGPSRTRSNPCLPRLPSTCASSSSASICSCIARSCGCAPLSALAGRVPRALRQRRAGRRAGP